MAYEKQNFEAGQILTAAQMNHIEEGIAQVENGMPTQLPSPRAMRFLKKSDSSVIAEYDGSEAVEVEMLDDTHIENVAKPLVTWENIPDKPFGRVEYAGLVLDSLHITFSDSQGVITRRFKIKEKGEYDVIWHGAVYTCTGVTFILEGYEVVWLGNLAALGVPDVGNPEAPFVIGCAPEEALEEMGAVGIVYALDGTDEIYLTISARDTVAPLDESMIPESIARLEQVEAMIDAKLAQLQGGA